MGDVTADNSSQFDLNDDDYDYLIKDEGIMNTCKEALLEVPCHEVDETTSKIDTFRLSTHESDTISSGPSSLSSTTSSVCTLINRTDLKTSCFLLDFNHWLTYTEKRVKSVCCCHEASDAYRKQRCLQAEVEKVGRKFIAGIKSLLDQNQQESDNTCEQAIKSKALRKLEKKWHSLWIVSLECLIIIEGGNCPAHFSPSRRSNNSRTPLKAVERESNFLNSPDEARDLSDHTPQQQANATPRLSHNSRDNKYHESVPEDFITPPRFTLNSVLRKRQLTSTPRKASRAHTLASLSDHFDLPQICIVDLMKSSNQKVQTMNATSTTTTTTTTTGAAAATAHAIVNTKGANFEIIHKDIGYSSDADTSDATADATSSGFVGSSSVSSSASSLASDCNSCNKNIGSPDTSVNSTNTQKRKVVKKRKVSSKLIGSTSCSTLYTSKQRPWSFHAASEWTDWDYYQPPSFIPSNECISSENVNTSPFDDESTLKSLTEFGENYENWFRTDDGAIALRMSIDRVNSLHNTSELNESKKSTEIENTLHNETTQIKCNVDASATNEIISEDESSFLSHGTSTTSLISSNTSKRSIGTLTNCSVSSSNESKKKKSSKSWIIFVAVSLVSLLVSVFFACTRATHIELLYPTNLPPI